MNWVIADIHGCAETLRKLIDRVKQADPDAKFVFVGDYCDRGMRSKESVDFLITLKDDTLAYLRGNHDDVVDWLLNGNCWTDLREFMNKTPQPWNIVPWWMMNGLKSTLESYGVSAHNRPSGPYNSCGSSTEIIEEFREKAAEHRQFYADLELTWENDTHFAVHAWANPGSEKPLLFDQGSSKPLWNRFPTKFPSGTLEYIEPVWDKIGVFGHTPVGYYKATAPIKMEKIRLIDCCAFDNEYLTAYCCESDDWILQATEPGDERK